MRGRYWSRWYCCTSCRLGRVPARSWTCSARGERADAWCQRNFPQYFEGHPCACARIPHCPIELTGTRYLRMRALLVAADLGQCRSAYSRLSRASCCERCGLRGKISNNQKEDRNCWQSQCVYFWARESFHEHCECPEQGNHGRNQTIYALTGLPSQPSTNVHSFRQRSRGDQGRICRSLFGTLGTTQTGQTAWNPPVEERQWGGEQGELRLSGLH